MQTVEGNGYATCFDDRTQTPPSDSRGVVTVVDVSLRNSAALQSSSNMIVSMIRRVLGTANARQLLARDIVTR